MTKEKNMYLKEIHIKDFRGIEDRLFKFDPHFNVIIGENAVGKTSLIEAISIGLGGLVKGLYYRNGRSITKDDIRIVDYHLKIQQANFSNIKTTADFFGTEYIWNRYREKDSDLYDLSGYQDVFNYGKYLANESKSGRFVTLPIISNYGVGRLLKENDSFFNPEKTSKRLDGYNRALNPNSNYKTLLSWFKSTEISVYKSGKQIDAISSVKRAIRNSFENIETLYFDYNNNELSVLFKGLSETHSKPVWSLSDGQKVLIGLIGDIALRCNLLNPRTEGNAHEITPGVVLVDELDLHLHPNWQKKIVNILKRTFPKIQFIVTTHSPFIVNSLKMNELISLQNIEFEKDYYRLSIEEIASNTMKVTDVRRSEKFLNYQTKAAEYFELLKDPQKNKETERLLDDLEIEFNDNPAYIALLKSERHLR